MSQIQQNYQNLLNEVKSINLSTQIVVVTKNQPIESILEAINAGATIIGENRVQEAESKIPSLPSSVQKHFIGHLQTNKVKKVIELFDVIESVDSLHLAEKINSECKKTNKIMPIMIEVNTSDEIQKYGVLPDKLDDFIQNCFIFSNLEIIGLMTVAKHELNPENCRPSFNKLKNLYNKLVQCKQDNVKIKYLSMGMTNDYQIALEEGSNLIRVGTRIFSH